MCMIEVELRGPLNGALTGRFKEFLDKESDDKKSYEEVAVFCDTDDIKQFGSFASGVARIQANQQTFGDGRVLQKVKMKIDAPTGHGREEHELRFSGQGLKSFFEILKRFGVSRGSFRACERSDYVIGNIEVSVKLNHVVGNHFEVETLCRDRSEIEKAKQGLLGFINPHGLTVWEPEEYKNIIMESRNKAPYIPFDEGIERFGIY